MSVRGLRPVVVLALVFVLGGAAGAAIMWAVAVDDLHKTMKSPPEKARAKFRLEAMRRHLDLSDDQVAKLEVIFEEGDRAKDAALEGCRPKLDQLRADLAPRIDEILTPEQRIKHAEMRQRMRERFGHSSASPGHGPPPPPL